MKGFSRFHRVVGNGGFHGMTWNPMTSHEMFRIMPWNPMASHFISWDIWRLATACHGVPWDASQQIVVVLRPVNTHPQQQQTVRSGGLQYIRLVSCSFGRVRVIFCVLLCGQTSCHASHLYCRDLNYSRPHLIGVHFVIRMHIVVNCPIRTQRLGSSTC